MGEDRKFKKKLQSGDWGTYIDLQRKILLSLEKLDKMLKDVTGSADITENQAFHFAVSLVSSDVRAVKKDEAKKILESIRLNSERISNILNGGGNEDKGLIGLTREEINNIENLLKSNPQLPPQVQLELDKIQNNFASKRLRMYEDLRNTISKEGTLGLELINVEEQSVREYYLKTLGPLANHLDQLINDKASDEAILQKLLEITYSMEDWRGKLGGEVKSFVRTFIKNETAKNDFIQFIDNYLKVYKKPIKDRIRSINSILSQHNSRFSDVPEEEREKVLKLFNEFTKDLFAGTSYASKFKTRVHSAELETLKEEFDEILNRFGNFIETRFKVNLSQEQLNSVIVYQEDHGFSLFKKRNRPFSPISIAMVRERINSNHKDLNKFLTQLIQKISDYVNGKDLDSFLYMQRDNFLVEVLTNKLVQDYRVKYGNALRSNIIGFGVQFENFQIYLTKRLFQLDDFLNMFRGTTNVIVNMFDSNIGNGAEVELNGAKEFKKVVLDEFNKVRDNKKEELSSLEVEINKIKPLLNLLKGKISGKESEIEKLNSIITELDEELRVALNPTEEYEEIRQKQGYMGPYEDTVLKTRRAQRDNNLITSLKQQIREKKSEIKQLESDIESLTKEDSTDIKDAGLARLTSELESKLSEFKELKEFLKYWETEVSQYYNQFIVLIEKYFKFTTSIWNLKTQIHEEFISKYPTNGETENQIWQLLNDNFTYISQEFSAAQNNSTSTNGNADLLHNMYE